MAEAGLGGRSGRCNTQEKLVAQGRLGILTCSTCFCQRSRESHLAILDIYLPLFRGKQCKEVLLFTACTVDFSAYRMEAKLGLFMHESAGMQGAWHEPGMNGFKCHVIQASRLLRTPCCKRSAIDPDEETFINVKLSRCASRCAHHLVGEERAASFVIAAAQVAQWPTEL